MEILLPSRQGELGRACCKLFGSRNQDKKGDEIMACWDCRHRTVETGGLAPKESQAHACIWVASLLASWRVSLGGKDGKMAGLQLAKNPITSFWKCKFDGGRSLPTRDVMAVASRYSWQKAETLRSSCKALPWCVCWSQDSSCPLADNRTPHESFSLMSFNMHFPLTEILFHPCLHFFTNCSTFQNKARTPLPWVKLLYIPDQDI